MANQLILSDDCKFLLWNRLDAHFQYGDHNVDRVYAQEVLRRGGPQQFHAKYLLLRWVSSHCTHNQWHWQWVALYHPRSGQLRKQLRHILNEGIWSSLAKNHGRTHAVISHLHFDLAFNTRRFCFLFLFGGTLEQRSFDTILRHSTRSTHTSVHTPYLYPCLSPPHWSLLAVLLVFWHQALFFTNIRGHTLRPWNCCG